jgi:hypothetical protein
MKYEILITVFLVFALIGSIRTSDYHDDMFFMHVNVNNDGTDDLDDLRVRVVFYDLGVILQTSNFDLQDGDSDGKFLFWNAENVDPGLYLARISVSNDDVKDVRHRLVTIA